MTGPTSIWALAGFRSLQGVGEARRKAAFFCTFAGSDQRRPLGVLTNVAALDEFLYDGWPYHKTVPVSRRTSFQKACQVKVSFRGRSPFLRLSFWTRVFRALPSHSVPVSLRDGHGSIDFEPAVAVLFLIAGWFVPKLAGHCSGIGLKRHSPERFFVTSLVRRRGLRFRRPAKPGPRLRLRCSRVASTGIPLVTLTQTYGNAPGPAGAEGMKHLSGAELSRGRGRGEGPLVATHLSVLLTTSRPGADVPHISGASNPNRRDVRRSVLAETQCDTPMVVPTRGFFEDIRRATIGDCYVGRGSRQRYFCKSLYCNNYAVSEYGRERAISQFAQKLKGGSELRARLRTLSGLRLVCPCKLSQSCHRRNNKGVLLGVSSSC